MLKGCTQAITLWKLTTDGHKVLRGLSATVELLVKCHQWSQIALDSDTVKPSCSSQEITLEAWATNSLDTDNPTRLGVELRQ